MRRNGITLIELIAVITILLVVSAAAIPMMLSGVESRRIRESARLLTAHIAGARAKAIETGRPAGVRFERFGTRSSATTVFYVETPAPYAGDYDHSKARVSGGKIVGLGLCIDVPNWASSRVDDVWTVQNLRIGDSIKLDYRGPLYTITGPVAAGGAVGPLPWTVVSPNGAPPRDTADVNPPYDPAKSAPDNGVGYQIIRQPVRSASAPLQIPEGAIIDLENSGVGVSTIPATDRSPVMLTFSPDGSLQYLYAQNGPGQRVLGAVHFLIGRSEAIGAENLADQTNLWVSVGCQTGQVTATENMGGTVQHARQFAISGQPMGGR